jgi:cobalt-zinc-cadmium efflux system protein
MSNEHSHSHHEIVPSHRMGLAVILTLALVAGEAVAGVLAQSLALVSDAGHNFADALALIFSWYAVRMARRPADAKRTFGYHRVGILAALANAASLVVIAVFIFWEAVQRFGNIQPVSSDVMIGVAMLAVLVNGVIAVWLHGGARHDLNMRSAYLHMLGDALSALGVLVAGAIVAATGSPLADTAVSLLIGALILWSSWGILNEVVRILLEAVPEHVDMSDLERAIRDVPGVLDVHDLHVWTVASGISACSCHVLVAEQSVRAGQQVIQGVAGKLRDQFAITHTTVQVEVEGCEPNDMYCTLRVLHQDHRAMDHGR